MMAQLEFLSSDAEVPVLFALHFLGGSAKEWESLADRMSGRSFFVPIDLPGFGDAGDADGYSVAEMADRVAAQIRRVAARRWVLVGHSMGAKVACAIARMAEDGADGLSGLSHMILLAGSPPGPEPMDEEKRRTMLGWFTRSAAKSREEADGYIRDNVGIALPPDLHERTVDDVLRAKRVAWQAWLESGSREDWSARIGVLATPVLIVAGERDAALGIEAQTSLVAPHFVSPRLHTMEGAGHLLPLECPDALADCIVAFLDAPHPIEPTIQPHYRALIDSGRVSSRTRQVLTERLKPVNHHPDIVTDDDMALLRATVDRVVPQGAGARIDIAARMVDAMARGPGDGWRFADLPADGVALCAGLRTLDAAARFVGGAGFASQPADRQDALLSQAAKGDLPGAYPKPEGQLSAPQMRLWFEDIRSAAVQIYVAHPSTLERLGYSGIANRGDGTGPQGFTRVGLGAREPWEPGLARVTPR